MKKRPTHESLIRQKLMETSVPSYTEGWKSMHSMLGSQPAEKMVYKAGWLKTTSVAAAILFLGGLTGWWMTDKTNSSKNASMVVSPEKQETPSTLRKEKTNFPIQKNKKPIPKQESVAARPDKSSATVKTDPALASNREKISLPSDLVHSDLVLLSSIPFLPLAKITIENEKMDLPEVHILLKQKPSIKDFSLPERKTALLSKIKEKEENTAQRSSLENHKFHLAVQLNANGGSSFGNANENYSPVLKGTPLDIYPSIHISKPLSSKLALQAGLAVVSPVNILQHGLSKSVSQPLRALEASVTDSRDQIKVSRLYYADIPVTLQYHLTDKLMVGSGFQLSVLEKIVGKKQRVDYDQGNLIMLMVPSQPDPRVLSRQGEAAEGIRPLDLRWLASIRYQFAKQWEASLKYQYGLTEISENKIFLNQHHDRNSMISAGIGFLIR